MIAIAERQSILDAHDLRRPPSILHELLVRIFGQRPQLAQQRVAMAEIVLLLGSIEPNKQALGEPFADGFVRLLVMQGRELESAAGDRLVGGVP